jgi:hypothetical protein
MVEFRDIFAASRLPSARADERRQKGRKKLLSSNKKPG